MLLPSEFFPFLVMQFVLRYPVLILEGQTTAAFIAATVVPYSALLLSIVGNVTQYRLMRAKEASELHTSTLNSYKEAYSAQGLVLDSEKAGKSKCISELETLSAEHETLIGIDAKTWMDYAKEGFHIENRRLLKELAEVKRRLNHYEREE